MLVFKSLFLLFLLPVCFQARIIPLKENPSDKKENSNTTTTTNDIPWLVSVQVHEWHSCVGSIIGQTWILTTASCIFGQIPKSITIRAGSTSHQKGGSIVQVKRLIQNEKYNSTQHDYDFGLIELTDKLNFSNNIQSIALPTTKDDIKNGTICSVYSWGMTKNSTGGSLYYRSLVPIVGLDFCKKQYQSINNVTEQMICAGKNTTVKKTCRDDNGAPLTWRDPVGGKLKLIGLSSWSKGCGDPNYPTVFANVESVLPWITKIAGI